MINIMKKINLLIILSFLLASCGGLSDAGKVLRNEKIKTTDEFLVKKKDPLELPPNFEELPLPNTKKDLDKSNKKIEEILNTSKVNVSKEKSSSVEESILDKIRK